MMGKSGLAKKLGIREDQFAGRNLDLHDPDFGNIIGLRFVPLINPLKNLLHH